MFRPAVWWIVAAAIVAGVLPVAAIAFLIAFGTAPIVAITKPLPSDAVLIERFTRDRAEFEELRLRRTEGTAPNATNELHLPVFAYNLPSHGPTKGYAWRRWPLPATATSLDWYRRSADEWRAYRPIGGGWYLYLEWGD